MIAFPQEGTAQYDFIRKQAKDRASKEEMAFPAEYMFKDVPHDLPTDDPVSVTLREMDRYHIERGLSGVEDENSRQALKQHPDRFVPSGNVDPNQGMDAVRKLVREHEEFGIRAAGCFPSGTFPQVPINDKKMYPIYAKCVELDIPIFVCAGVPGSRLRLAPQKVELIDEVMFDFPDLVLAASVAGFVERHAPSESTRKTLDAPAAGARPGFWDALVAQGLPSLHLPEDGGGGGGTGLDLAVVVEETGRGLLPGPFLPTVLTGALLTWYGDGPSAVTAVKRLAEGARATCTLTTDGLTARRTDTGYTITGTTGLILAPSGAEVLLLGAALDDSEVWFVVEGTDIHIEPATGVDLTRGLGRLTLRDLRVDAGHVLTLDASRVRSVAAALFSAEAVGLVRWCVEQGLAYAKTREQFGRPIGSFQAIKHKCARMFVELETMTASAWDAARALDNADDVQLDLAAAGAAAVCLPAARRLALETITLFGGIGYTWEHDAHLYWRRAVSLESLLGPITGWQRHLGDLALHAERDFTIEVDENAGFRDRIAALLASAAALDEPARRHRLAETGLVTPHFPEPYGLAATATQQIVIAQEYEKAGLTQPSMVVGDWAVPTILTHGTPEQIATLVPPTLRGERVWCQLFSEPGAGSDLASLRTRASKVDGGWRINGQKVWTSQAHEADWAICLARTDPDVPKHKGLSYFLVDMRSEGVEVRPLREANGEYMFNEVFLNDVFVPDNRLVAEPGQGWTLARTTLGNERVSIAGYAKSSSTTPALAQAADTPDALRELGELTAQAQAIAALSLRSTLRSVEGLRPGAEASVAKVATAWHTTAAAEKALQWAGPNAAQQDGVVHSYLSLPAQLLGGGTLEIQLNVISERLLGLPREHHPR